MSGTVARLEQAGRRAGLLSLAQRVADDRDGEVLYGPRVAAQVLALAPNLRPLSRSLLWTALVGALRSGDAPYAHNIARVMTKGPQ